MLDLELGVAQLFYEAEAVVARREDLTYEARELPREVPPPPCSVCCLYCGSELHSLRGHAGRCRQNVKAAFPSFAASRVCSAERRHG